MGSPSKLPRKVLLMHGLDTAPHGGNKGATLRKHYDHVHIEYMRLKEFRSASWRGHWTFLAARLVALGAGVGAMVSLARALMLWIRARRALARGTAPPAGWMRNAAVALVYAGVGRALLKRLIAHGVLRMLEQSVEIQRKALETFQPDVVVGSSWGGATAVECMRRGLWTGPTVLIAPAQHAAARRIGVVDARRLRVPAQGTAVVVHGEADDVVPLADSFALMLASGAVAPTSGGTVHGTRDDHARAIDFIPVAKGDHRMQQPVRDGMRDWVERAIVLHQHQEQDLEESFV